MPGLLLGVGIFVVTIIFFPQYQEWAFVACVVVVVVLGGVSFCVLHRRRKQSDSEPPWLAASSLQALGVYSTLISAALISGHHFAISAF
jgi:ABC-type transport system involved in cytochrome c biogenesis permease subunit